ncbi:hypothetical protein J4467_01790 [Candidatus Woesearchaeota archaeon]|nr:hypothetical protein [Candidatus Woesearchaeota archaeon]
MKSKKQFKGRDAVAVAVIWSAVYLFVTYLLNKTVTSENVLIMLIGLVIFFIITIILRNGW